MSTMSELDLVVREVSDRLIEIARNSGSEPVVIVTGNSMAPSWRWFDAMEAVWQEYEDDTACWVWEDVEHTCADAEVYVGSTDDGSIYFVDENRFEYRDDVGADHITDNGDYIETYSDEWREIKS